MNTFIWQNRKPCLSFSLTNKHMNMGGLGLPNIWVYHFTVTLDQIKYWCKTSPDKNWSLLGALMMNISDWKGVMLDQLSYLTSTFSMSLPICTTLQYWMALLSGKYLQLEASPISIPLSFAPIRKKPSNFRQSLWRLSNQKLFAHSGLIHAYNPFGITMQKQNQKGKPVKEKWSVSATQYA